MRKGEGRDVGICQRRRRIAQLGAPVRARSIVEPGEQETKAELGCHIQLRAEHVVQGGDSAWDVKQWEHGEFGQLEAMTVHDFRSEEHTSELQSLMRISYAVFCLK